MAADGTYQPKVYHKRGGDETVVANGGAITIESGGAQTVESGGNQVIESGGKIDMEPGAEMRFFNDEDFSSQEMAAANRISKTTINTNQSTGGTVLSDAGGSSPPVIPSTVGVYLISTSAAMTNGSVRLYSGLVGQRLHIRLTNAAQGSVGCVWVMASGAGFTGVQLQGSTRIQLSAIALRQSAASCGWVDLLCIEDGVWAVITTGGDVTEKATA